MSTFLMKLPTLVTSIYPRQLHPKYHIDCPERPLGYRRALFGRLWALSGVDAYFRQAITSAMVNTWLCADGSWERGSSKPKLSQNPFLWFCNTRARELVFWRRNQTARSNKGISISCQYIFLSRHSLWKIDSEWNYGTLSQSCRTNDSIRKSN